MSTIAINPTLQTNALGSFNVSADGFIQGTLLDNPPDLFRIAGGTVDPSETLPMWGGIGITEFIPDFASGGSALNQIQSQGPALKRATGIAAPTTRNQSTTGQLTGFAIFNQAHNMIQSPQSPVPISLIGNMVNFVRLGSGVRIAVAASTDLVTLKGLMETSLVSWDYTGQLLVPFIAAYAANVLTAQTWAAGVVTFTTTTGHNVTVGTDFEISGSTPAGYNGRYTAITGTASSTLVAVLATDPGASTVLGTLVAGGGALPVKVLSLELSNSMTVSYNATTGAATWNRSGACAEILI